MQLLRDEPVAHIAVTTDEGPYVTPISFVYSGQDIAFRTRSGARLEAIRLDARVCIEVSRYEPSGAWKSVIVRGRAREVEDAQLIQDVMSAILRKYRDAFGNLLSNAGSVPLGDEAVVAVDIDDLTGRSSGSLFGLQTRPGRM